MGKTKTAPQKARSRILIWVRSRYYTCCLPPLPPPPSRDDTLYVTKPSERVFVTHARNATQRAHTNIGKRQNTACDYEIQPSPGRFLRKNDVAPRENTHTYIRRYMYLRRWRIIWVIIQLLFSAILPFSHVFPRVSLYRKGQQQRKFFW